MKAHKCSLILIDMALIECVTEINSSKLADTLILESLRVPDRQEHSGAHRYFTVKCISVGGSEQPS